VLFDGRNKGGPDHSQVLFQWYEEERRLIVIDGNGGGFALAESQANAVALAENDISNDGVSKLAKQNILQNKLSTEVIFTNNLAVGRVGVTCHILTQANQVNPPDNNLSAPYAQIWAIIRPSIADFENHQYKNLQEIFIVHDKSCE